MPAIAAPKASDLRPLEATFHRLVESQEEVATNSLVENLDEQAVLEDMLEESKPKLPPECAGLHYLFATPFRYPPLRWGSRFGSALLPGIFYGSASANTMLWEAAFYRFVFVEAMQLPFPQPVKSNHTEFTGKIKAAQALALELPPFGGFVRVLCSPTSYAATQQLGERMRALDVQAFSYPSARCPEGGLNYGLFTPKAFGTKEPRETTPWLCAIEGETLSFYCKTNKSLQHFEKRAFLIQGKFARPAV
ncbi:MAG: RES family NAD+ phosphorylase [Limnobacter sp.]|nr:RES family NAD+ phosphorylase [Limnobacter sp.]